MTTCYTKMILETLARNGHVGINPHHVEAYMRISHSCLDGLSRGEFQSEVMIAADCVIHGGEETAKQVADSMGLGCKAQERRSEKDHG